MTPEKLAELRELEKKATPGPWKKTAREWVDGGVKLRQRHLTAKMDYNWPLGTDNGDQAEADCDLTCAMRNSLPDLLDAAEKAEAWHRSYDRLMTQFLQLDQLYMGAWQEGANTCLANDALSRQLQVLAGECTEALAASQEHAQTVTVALLANQQLQADLAAAQELNAGLHETASELRHIRGKLEIDLAASQERERKLREVLVELVAEIAKRALKEA